jgi:hypothetical protein
MPLTPASGVRHGAGGGECQSVKPAATGYGIGRIEVRDRKVEEIIRCASSEFVVLSSLPMKNGHHFASPDVRLLSYSTKTRVNSRKRQSREPHFTLEILLLRK